MKTSLPAILLTAVFIGTGYLALAADDLPQAPAFARYEPMMKRSPFAVATAVAIPAATPNFAKDLYIANAARTSDGDLVTIASSTDKNFKKYLSTKAPVDGYSVPEIEWSDRVGATKVTIQKDGQTASLTFNQALLSQSAANFVPPPQAQPVQAAQPQGGIGVAPTQQYNPPQPQLKPAPIPTLPTPPPRVRGVIPRNPNTAAAVQPDPEVEEKEEQ